jgi:hypothetical protein
MLVVIVTIVFIAFVFIGDCVFMHIATMIIIYISIAISSFGVTVLAARSAFD